MGSSWRMSPELNCPIVLNMITNTNTQNTTIAYAVKDSKKYGCHVCEWKTERLQTRRKTFVLLKAVTFSFTHSELSWQSVGWRRGRDEQLQNQLQFTLLLSPFHSSKRTLSKFTFTFYSFAQNYSVTGEPGDFKIYLHCAHSLSLFTMTMIFLFHFSHTPELPHSFTQNNPSLQDRVGAN